MRINIEKLRKAGFGLAIDGHTLATGEVDIVSMIPISEGFTKTLTSLNTALCTECHLSNTEAEDLIETLMLEAEKRQLFKLVE